MEDRFTRVVAFATGIVFVALAALSATPGLTTGELAGWGTGSTAKLAGVFATSKLVITLEIVLGLAGLACARSFTASYRYLWCAVVLTALAWFYGFVTVDDGAGNFLPSNAADDALWFVLAVAIGWAFRYVTVPKLPREHHRHEPRPHWR
jgi:hypothetical protein